MAIAAHEKEKAEQEAHNLDASASLMVSHHSNPQLPADDQPIAGLKLFPAFNQELLSRFRLARSQLWLFLPLSPMLCSLLKFSSYLSFSHLRVNLLLVH